MVRNTKNLQECKAKGICYNFVSSGGVESRAAVISRFFDTKLLQNATLDEPKTHNNRLILIFQVVFNVFACF